MAYKFQFGTTKLSGSTTFEESLIGQSTISGSGRLSGKELILDAAGVIGTSADADLMTLTADKVAVAGELSASLALAGGNILLDATGKIGTSDDADLFQLAANSVSVNGALSASGQVDLPGAVRFGTENQLTVSGVGLLSGSATATLANATLDQITVGSADINGGTVDGAVIGGNSAAAGTFTTVTGTNISGSGTLQAAGIVTAGNGKFTVSTEAVVAATSLSASNTLGGLSLVLDAGGTGVIGVTGDLDLLTLTANTATVAGALKATTLSASSTMSVEGVSSFGPGALASISAAGVLSGSGISTLYGVTTDALIAQTVDINGGAIDAATIGASSQTSGKFTTLSASSTLDVAGVSSFGLENQTTVSAVGLLSSSATATLANATLDRITAPVLIGDMSGSGGLTLAGTVAFGNNRLYVSDSQVLMTGPVHVSGAAFAEESITVGNVAADKSRLAFYDIDSGEMKTTDFKVYADVLAGTGITATDGVLSVDTTGGDSMTSTHIPLANYGNAVLTAGINYMTSDATGSCNFALPSGSAGDIIVVKTAAGVSSTNYVKISSSLNKNEIDGFSQAVIESPHGAISLIWAESDAKWVIY